MTHTRTNCTQRAAEARAFSGATPQLCRACIQVTPRVFNAAAEYESTQLTTC
jgi:hypothetical protein